MLAGSGTVGLADLVQQVGEFLHFGGLVGSHVVGFGQVVGQLVEFVAAASCAAGGWDEFPGSLTNCQAAAAGLFDEMLARGAR